MEKWIPISKIGNDNSMESFIANIIRENKDLDSEGITVYLIDQGTITDVAWSKIVREDIQDNAWVSHKEICILHEFDQTKVQRIAVFPKKYKNIILISYDKEAFDVYTFNEKEMKILSNVIDLYPKDLKTVLRVHNSKSDRYYYDSKMHTAFPDVCKCYDRLLGITE
nr:MAG TPA: hypothetical protein [Caudoviricetes sp.]